MMKSSKKRDVWIWSAFVVLGLMLFASGIFDVIKIDGFDCRYWASIFLSACAVFSCYFADTKKSGYAIYSGAAILRGLLIADFFLESAILRLSIFLLSIVAAIFLIAKYKSAQETEIAKKKRLTEPAFSEVNKFNLFANAICFVGLFALLFGVYDSLAFRIAVALFIVLVSLILTYVKQRYKRVIIGQKLNIKEYMFLAFWLFAALVGAIILRDVRHVLGYAALTIIVLMTDYFIFDRPQVLEEIARLAGKTQKKI